MSKTLTGKEALELFINKGMLMVIGEDMFVPTSKVEAFLGTLKAQTSLEVPMPKTVSKLNLFPVYIREASPENTIACLLDYCKVPVMMNSNGMRYMVRTNDATTRTLLKQLMTNPKLDIKLFLDLITKYYKEVSMPVSFKRFVNEGLLKDLYTKAANGEPLGFGEKADNKVWK